ncbi:family 1 glycosylhydrolase [Methylomagnum sp.]
MSDRADIQSPRNLETPLIFPPLELWGGVECTVNRIGDRFFDQLERSGHARRLHDLDRFRALGLSTLRYPVLWERVAPRGLDRADWGWSDERLARLRELGIRPIVGLVHHGSGPAHTRLDGPGFVTARAEYAQAVAERYPWIEDYTPVNEPLTTARFSGLYGHWYPHARDERCFVLCLLNQCRATAAAMAAIRRAAPTARLIQTDDLGKTYATRPLAHQAGFENHRRWLSWDFLCGRVRPGHPLWAYLRESGGLGEDWRTLAEQPCPPDLIGVNYYLTSERHLDHRFNRYPPEERGGNGQRRYADAAAVRVRREGIAGPRRLLAEAWERYGIPLAITEAHLGCTREEQVRWLWYVWTEAQAARAQGVDVRTVTAWALLGSYDWNTLLTSAQGFYEPGAFDLQAPAPRPTAVADLIRDLAGTGGSAAPVLDSPGWWLLPERLHPGLRPTAAPPVPPRPPRPILIAGAGGTLGRAFAHLCRQRGLEYRRLFRREMDIADSGSVTAALDAIQPWAVINAAGHVRADEAEHDPRPCFRTNCEGSAVLAAACAERGIRLVAFSSDLVFDGRAGRPYVESDPVAPLSMYGQSKAEAEHRTLAALPEALVIRASAFFGPWDAHNFVTQTLAALAAGLPWLAAEDAVVSPTYVPDLVNAALDLLIDGEAGLWHLANAGALSWVDLARRAALGAGLDPGRVIPRSRSELGWAAPRPAYSALASERGSLMPPLDEALARYLRARESQATP